MSWEKRQQDSQAHNQHHNSRRIIGARRDGQLICDGMIVNHPRLACPHCDSDNNQRIYGIKNANGEKLRYVRCEDCHFKYKTLQRG